MAGKFCGILLCSDFDGTLTCDGRSVSAENREAIAHFEKNGGLFSIASGRCPSHFLGIEGLTLNTYAITLNGNVIYDFRLGKALWTNPLEPETIEAVLRFLTSGRDDWDELRVYTIDGWHTYYRECDADISEFMQALRGIPAAKLVVTQSPEIGRPLREALESEFRTLSFSQSWPEGLEMNTLSGGKGNAVRKLRELLGGDAIRTVVCVGDYENDISMIEYADIGYAVGNALEMVKAAADRVTVSNRANAIARIIADLDDC